MNPLAPAPAPATAPTTEGDDGLRQRLQDLRQTFDRGFAAGLPDSPRADAAPVALLLLRAGGQDLAVLLSELAGIEALRKIVPLPGPPRHNHAALLGVSGVRGKLLPVYSLARLLGAGTAADADLGAGDRLDGDRQPAPEGDRWLAVVQTSVPAAQGGCEQVAFALSRVTGYRTVSADTQRAMAAGAPQRSGAVIGFLPADADADGRTPSSAGGDAPCALVSLAALLCIVQLDARSGALVPPHPAGTGEK